MDFANSDLRFARAADQLSCELDGEIAILSLGSKLYFGLTDVAAGVWHQLETPQGFEDIVGAVMAQYDVEAEQCRSDVAAFLETLSERGLLQVQEGPA